LRDEGAGTPVNAARIADNARTLLFRGSFRISISITPDAIGCR
jgi:hypothetical protein